MIKSLNNEKGAFTVVSIIILTVLMGYMAASLTDMTNVDTSSTSNTLQIFQAQSIGNGGTQEAIETINRGQSPDVTNKALGVGTYTTVTDPSAQKVTVTGMVGQAKSLQTFSLPFSQQCMDLNVTAAYQSSRDLKGLELIKSCNAASTLTKMKIEWNWSACATGLTCTGTTGTPSPSADPSVGKQTICHIPPGNPANAHTISVGQPAVQAHLAHGDTLGACTSGDTSTAVVCEGYDTDVAACGPADLGAKVKSIIVNGTTIANNISASSSELIDVSDLTFTANQTYAIDQIRFDQDLPEGAWYAVTVYFADGSSIRKAFKFGSSATPPAPAPTPVFSTTDNAVTVVANKTVNVRVIGTSLACHSGRANGSVIPVRVDIGVNDVYTAIYSNNQVTGGESYTTTTGASSLRYKIRGRASLSTCSNFNAMYDSGNSTQVKTLVNGDQAPAMQGFGGAATVQAFLAPYLTSQGRVVLNANQVIMLFEMDASGNGNSAATDFQDLVVVFTIT